MLDRERVLAKIDALDGYLRELREILPANFKEYKRIEKGVHVSGFSRFLLDVSSTCVV